MTIGSRSTTRHTPVASFKVDVTAAAAASVTNGSSVCLYSSGSGAPSGRVASSAGMCVCSGTHSDSKPASSTSCANSTGEIEYSVPKIATPNFTVAAYRPSASSCAMRTGGSSSAGVNRSTRPRK